MPTQPFKDRCILLKTNTMKITNVFLGLFILLSSCNNDDDIIAENSRILGTWELVASLTDIGNGNGTFEPASGVSIEFKRDGSFTITTDSCIDSQDTSNKSGTFDLETMIINFQNFEGRIQFNNEFLEIYNTRCIEPCGSRFIKVR